MKSVLTSLLLICAVAFSVFAEKTNVFFVHGANVSESDARTWASEMFKRLWQAGADMEFYPVAWESDIGPAYNYQVNASNAFSIRPAMRCWNFIRTTRTQVGIMASVRRGTGETAGVPAERLAASGS